MVRVLKYYIIIHKLFITAGLLKVRMSKGTNLLSIV